MWRRKPKFDKADEISAFKKIRDNSGPNQFVELTRREFEAAMASDWGKTGRPEDMPK